MSGSYSSPFLFLTERKIPARYWPSLSHSMSSNRRFQKPFCKQLYVALCCPACLGIFHWIYKIIRVTFGNIVKPIALCLCHVSCKQTKLICKQTTPEIQEVACTRRTIMGFLYEAPRIWIISLGWNYGLFTSVRYTYGKAIILMQSIIFYNKTT